MPISHLLNLLDTPAASKNVPPFISQLGLSLTAVCFSLSALLWCLMPTVIKRQKPIILGLFKVFTWYFWKIWSVRELTQSQVWEILIQRDRYGHSGNSLMSSDLKGLVKSWKVKGHENGLSLVGFSAGPRRLEPLTEKDGAVLIAKKNKELSRCPYSFIFTLMSTIFSGPRN